MEQILSENDLRIDQFLSDRLSIALKSDTKSLRSISLTTNINRKTLAKIKNQEASLSSIDPLKILKLIKLISAEDYPETVEKFKNQIRSLGKGYEAIFSYLEDTELLAANRSESHRDLLSDRTAFLVFILATNRTGTTRAELSSILGAQYENALLNLLDKNILTEEDGLITNADEKTYFSRDFVKNNIGFLNDFYSSSHACQNRNYIFYTAQKINKPGLNKCQEIMQTAHKEILKVMQDPSYAGDIPFFSTGVLDTFVNDINEKGVLQ